MQDLIDAHRANIAKAGVKLAEDIAAATGAYNAAIAASEAATAVALDRRMAALHEALRAPPGEADAPGAEGPQDVLTSTGEGSAPATMV